LAKIAIELERALARRIVDGAAGRATPRVLARGRGWSVADVICTSGPQDHPFEEQHSHVSIAIVVAGSFQYRSTLGRELMTPGSVMLGNAGQCYECGHEHAPGDRCVSFQYAPDYFEGLAADAGTRDTNTDFRMPRLPPLRVLSPLVARAAAGVVAPANAPWEELAVTVAMSVVQLARGGSLDRLGRSASPAGAVARVTRVLRRIQRDVGAGLTLDRLAKDAGLSPYHFLRTFEHLTGVTPHQYVLRTRLREAALRLAAEAGTVLDIALDCGFGDVSNFNRAFRAEFGVNPRRYRVSADVHRLRA
jgi:AraC-like DNA-binding protein